MCSKSCRMTESVILGVGDEVIVLTIVFMAVVWTVWLLMRRWNVSDRLFARIGSIFQQQNFDPPISGYDTQPQADSQVLHRAYPADACPICLGGYSFKVETNCGHTFCEASQPSVTTGPCIRTYLQNEAYVIRTMQCPLCRQPLTLLFNSYTEEERRAAADSEIGTQRIEMNILINRFNRIAAGTPKTLLQNIYDWPVLIRRLFDELFSQRPMLLFRLRIVLLLFCGAVYVFSPVDVLPEAVYGILGFIDDILVVLFCIWYMVNVYRSFVANREDGFE